MTKQYKIVVEYPPNLPIQDREAVDRLQMKRLQQEHPMGTIVGMDRKLISDYRAHLFATLEWK